MGNGKKQISFVLFGEKITHEFDSAEKADYFKKQIKLLKLNKPFKTLTEAFESYKAYEVVNKSKTSQKGDILLINRFLEFSKGRGVEFVVDVDYFLIRDFQKHLLTLMSETSVNRSFNTLKHSFKKFVDWDYIQKSPCGVKRLKDNDVYIKLWTKKDLFKVMQLINENDRYVLQIMWHTGARLRSVLDLQTEDIDFKNNFIRFKTNKGGKRVYTVPLPKELNLLKGINLPFTNSLGNLYTSHYFISKFNKLDYAKEKGLRLHHIRHTYASRMYEKGVDVDSISRLLGHTSTKILHKYLTNTHAVLQNRLKKIG